ncbi:MAG: hypothetical protein RMH74_04055 [Candidatus Caldarchaeum sp.]|nr:hypothetical protein [Candidatus Caldarchaeum sp.]
MKERDGEELAFGLAVHRAIVSATTVVKGTLYHEKGGLFYERMKRIEELRMGEGFSKH